MSCDALAPAPDFNAERELIQLSEQIVRTIAVARGLIESGRAVDLGGIKEQVGFVCARALDMPPARAGLARSQLQRLLTLVDSLHHAVRRRAA